MKNLVRLSVVALALSLCTAASAQTAKVVIDPGHGGSDPGATGHGQTEANNVLNTSIKFRDWLNADSGNGSGGGSWHVLMTRTTNVFVGLSARAAYANNNGAHRFMSIHNNACCGASGTETFAYTTPGAQATDLRNKIQQRSVQAWGLTNRGNKNANFAVLRETVMPATLAELGFITHAYDAGFLGHAGHQDNMAKHHMWALQNHYGIGAFTPGGFTVGGAIQVRHNQLGGNGGILGAPITNELTTPDGIGRYNHFQHNGSIYWTPSTGAWEVYGSIRVKWSALGWENSDLGYPTTGEGIALNGGRFNHFQNGSIYWHPNTGAHEIRGAIHAKWEALGWEHGPNGFPTTDEQGTPDGVGRYNHFQNGSIYWHPSTGAHSVVGAIHAKWADLGWENSSLGYPTSDEYDIPGGRRSNFQNGTITWNASTGQVTVP